jgi:hypothetical protein
LIKTFSLLTADRPFEETTTLPGKMNAIRFDVPAGFEMKLAGVIILMKHEFK